MKTVLTIFALFSSFVCLAQCKPPPMEHWSDLERFGKVIGKVKKVRWSIYAPIPPYNDSIRKGTKGLNIDNYYLDSFDDAGHKVLSCYMHNSIVGYRCEYKFDVNGNMIEERWSDRDTITDVKTRAYDEKGKITLEKNYSKGNLSYSSTYVYDEMGKIIQDKSYDREGNLSAYSTYTYDGIGRLIELKYNGVNMSLSNYIKYTYVAPNITIEEQSISQSQTRFEYKCDNNGRLIEKTAILGDGKNYTIQFAYDVRGNKILEQTDSWSITYKYDNADNEILKVTGDEALGTKYISKYVYDGHGNWVNKTSNYVEGVMVGEHPSVVREIEYY